MPTLSSDLNSTKTTWYQLDHTLSHLVESTPSATAHAPAYTYIQSARRNTAVSPFQEPEITAPAIFPAYAIPAALVPALKIVAGLHAIAAVRPQITAVATPRDQIMFIFELHMIERIYIMLIRRMRSR
jgi:hypothetical protein